MPLNLLEPYLEPCETSKMAYFAKIVNSFQPLTIFTKHSILDVSQGSEYSSDYLHFFQSCKRDVFRNLQNIYDGAFLHWYLSTFSP